MRGYFIILLFLFIGQSGISQTSKELDLLIHSPEFKMDSSGFSSMPWIKSSCSDSSNQGNFWHVQDLNQDGQKDLIYSGPCKPYMQTEVYLSIGDSFTKIFEYAGRLVDITYGNETVSVYTSRSAIGCDYFNTVLCTTIGMEGIISQREIICHYTIELEAYKIEKTTLSGKLRTSMIEDDDGSDPCFESTMGNVLEVLDNQEVVVLREKDSWKLVAVDYNSFVIIGWILPEMK